MNIRIVIDMLTIFGGLILGTALLLWGATVLNILTMHKSDPAGNALSNAFAHLMSMALWVLMTMALFLAFWRGSMPAGVAAAAAVLVPGSLAATLLAIQMLGSDTRGLHRWPILLPVLIPLAMMLYAALLLFDSWSAGLSIHTISWTVWPLVAWLSASVIPGWWVYVRARAERRASHAARHAESDLRELAARRDENFMRFRALTPNSHLKDWLSFTTGGNELRHEALARIRTLERRQSDAEEMIQWQVDLPMLELPNLQLELTPRLQDCIRQFLIRDAQSFERYAKEFSPYSRVAFRAERHLHVMRWLILQNCNLDAVIDAYTSVALLFAHSRERDNFLGKLQKMQFERQRQGG